MALDDLTLFFFIRSKVMNIDPYWKSGGYFECHPNKQKTLVGGKLELLTSNNYIIFCLGCLFLTPPSFLNVNFYS
jgi:hypothetical protein